MRRHAATAAAAGMGITLLWLATDGLLAFTSESARRLDVARSPRDVPAVRLVDQTGAAFRLHDLPGKRVFVEFVFTRCASVCGSMARAFARAARDPAFAGDAFVSISFDSAYDTLTRLRAYAARVGADGARWRFARIDDPSELAALLERFGVVVLPDPRQGFEHNAAVHELDAERRLVAIHGLERFGG